MLGPGVTYRRSKAAPSHSKARKPRHQAVKDMGLEYNIPHSVHVSITPSIIYPPCTLPWNKTGARFGVQEELCIIKVHEFRARCNYHYREVQKQEVREFTMKTCSSAVLLHFITLES